MYKVIKHFVDLQDNNYRFNVGDEFPRKGAEVTLGRIDELAGNYNKQGVPLIEKEPPDSTKEEPKQEEETTEEEPEPEKETTKEKPKRGRNAAEK